MTASNVNGGSDLSPEARKRLVSQLRVTLPARSVALRALEKCMEDSAYSAEPTSIFIGGASGAGKSSLLKTFEANHPVEKGEEVDKLPVLLASLPSGCSRKDAASKILDKLGDKRAYSGQLNQLTHRLSEYLKRREVKIVVLDEFQHLIDRDSKKVIATTADWIKELIIESQLPFALVGLTEALSVFDVNPQLSRRFTRRMLLKPLQWSQKPSADGPGELTIFLGQVDKNLPFGLSAGLDLDETVRWFHHHTEGILGRVITIVREAAYLAIDRGADRIEQRDLVAALSQMTIDIKDAPPVKRNSKPQRSKDPNISEVLRAR